MGGERGWGWGVGVCGVEGIELGCDCVGWRRVGGRRIVYA